MHPHVDVDTINGLATDDFLQGLKPLLSAGEVRLWSSFLSNCPAQLSFGCCQQCLVPCHLQLRHYFSADNTEETSKSHLYPMEFLNSLNPSGSPPHDLKLKEGMPVMLLRNLTGLADGMRLVSRRFYNRLMEAEVVTGPRTG